MVVDLLVHDYRVFDGDALLGERDLCLQRVVALGALGVTVLGPQNCQGMLHPEGEWLYHDVPA